MKKILHELKQFAFQGNVIDLAVGVMIGGAFSKIVASLVNDMFMPIIGLITGGFDFSSLFIALDGKSYTTLDQARAAGAATLNYGVFITQIMDFVIMAICIFIFVKLVNRFRGKLSPKNDEPKQLRHCPYCLEAIPDMATRCPHCTSVLEPLEND